MMKKTKKWLALAMAGAMMLSLAGCGEKKKEVSSGSEVKLAEGGIYPVECADELTAWGMLNSELSVKVSNFGETDFAKHLSEKTGIKVNYIHPAQGQQNEQFNLLLASNDLPDLIQYNWYNYGAQAAIDNGYILELNDIMEKWTPNLVATLKTIPDIDKEIKTDEGSYYVFPSVTDPSKKTVNRGPIIRGDWLEKLGMDIPETIDDWDKMLRGFKNEIGCPIPLSLKVNELHGAFSGAYGVYAYQTVYLDDGKIVFGQAEDGWKDYLTQMNKWYKEGLLDQNIASFDYTVQNTNMLNGRTGALLGSAGGSMATWLGAKEKEDPSYKLVGAEYPVLNKGDKAEFAMLNSAFLPGYSYAISAQCKNVELAARFMDYGYSEEGRRTYAFGIEDVSYTMENGEPTFTDLILKSDESISNAMVMYCNGSYAGPFLSDDRTRVAMQSKYNAVIEAVDKWSGTNAPAHVLPQVSFTTEESAELSNIKSELTTYVDEMTMKFITGKESLDKFEEYQKQCKKFGLDRMLEIYEDAYERYNKR